jgi:hypothetical protein
MTNGLLTLPKREVPWSSPNEPLFIGKDLLELLTSSMYVDPMSMYREYIQNSADSVDVARSLGILQSAGRVEIRIDHAARAIFIRDNGEGLGHESFIHQLTALGGSKKRGTSARGFRGVGRLAGLAFCHELIFRSRQEGEDQVHELCWDSRLVRSLLRSSDSSDDLTQIVAKALTVRDISGRAWPERFFEVELRGVIRHRDDRLLNEDLVKKYLAQVAPVPFSPDFTFGPEIQSFLTSNGIHAGPIEVEILGHGKVYRPYKSSMLIGRLGEIRFRELSTFITPGRDGGVAAASWLLHHDYLGAFSSSSLIEGWRLRSGDIQIGDNEILKPYFSESRFNSWAVAETHIIDPRIIPNGRRDHFEQNAHYFDLVNNLAPHVRNIGQRCRTSSIARNSARAIAKLMADCHQKVRILEKGLIPRNAASKLVAYLNNTLDKMQRLLVQSGISEQQKKSYQVQIAGIRQRIMKLQGASSHQERLSNFSPIRRRILNEVINTIYQTAHDLVEAQNLIDKILSRLKRSDTLHKA